MIINLEGINLNKKALYVNNKKYYILETTATNSKIAFPLKYKIEEIEAIINPFTNKNCKLANRCQSSQSWINHKLHTYRIIRSNT